MSGKGGKDAPVLCVWFKGNLYCVDKQWGENYLKIYEIETSAGLTMKMRIVFNYPVNHPESKKNIKRLLREISE